MLDQLLRTLTPELVTHAIKSNPKAIVEAIQKFPTFQLLGAGMTPGQQTALSSNIYMINDFLASSEGKTSVSLWAEEFVKFVNTRKLNGAGGETRAQLEARISKELEAKYAAQAKQETLDLENKVRAELEAKFKADFEARSKVQ